jgi:hypothetical protein
MFVKVYRYRIQPDKTDACLAIQERAARIYRKHIRYRSVHLRNLDDPCQWLEIHWYPDEETYRNRIDRINSDPEIDRLWSEFQGILDPDHDGVSEEMFEQLMVDENLGNR